MKFSNPFSRKDRAGARRPVRAQNIPADWTAREWADLPVHHPRQP